MSPARRGAGAGVNGPAAVLIIPAPVEPGSRPAGPIVREEFRKSLDIIQPNMVELGCVVITVECL